jgi:hypothetical protein
MTEVAYEDYLLGEVIVSFDGRVVEVFRRDVIDTLRAHARQLHVEVSGPDRRGRHTIEFATTSRGRGGFKLTVPGEAWDDVSALVKQVTAAATA